jgi:signal transduction histidine kinase
MIEKLSARWERHGYPRFVWWIPLVMYGSTAIALVIGVAQRAGSGHVLAAAGLALLSAVPWLFDACAVRLQWWLSMLLAAVPTLVLMAGYPVPYDFAVFALVMLVGHLGALEKFVASLAATVLVGAAVAALGVTGQIEASAFWIAGIVVGWDIGFIMQYQQRRLDAQEEAAVTAQAQAVLEERQRIAREVHDVIAHSLSVTLLHVTAARRMLSDDDLLPADITEAGEALDDAERVGRQAMAEIRHTVGLLGSDGADGAVRPAPDLTELPTLVEEFRSAGLDVVLDITGTPEEVPQQTALGLYRIAQESLSNVAKHQPRARTVVVLEADARSQELQVWNTLPTGLARSSASDGGGAGIPGMRQRADLLDGAFSAGPRDGVWVVEVRVPGSAPSRCRLGLPKLMRTGFRAAPGPGTVTP